MLEGLNTGFQDQNKTTRWSRCAEGTAKLIRDTGPFWTLQSATDIVTCLRKAAIRCFGIELSWFVLVRGLNRLRYWVNWHTYIRIARRCLPWTLSLKKSSLKPEVSCDQLSDERSRSAASFSSLGASGCNTGPQTEAHRMASDLSFSHCSKCQWANLGWFRTVGCMWPLWGIGIHISMRMCCGLKFMLHRAGSLTLPTTSRNKISGNSGKDSDS